MKNIIFSLSTIFLFSAVLSSCGSKNPDHIAQDELTKEIWVVHDDVMPKTSEINRIQRTLRKLTDGQDLAPDDPVLDMLNRLESAHEGMMVWMKEFQQPSKLRGEKSHEEIMAYLVEQKAEIEKVKEDMLGAIADGQKMVDSYTKAE